MSHTVISKKTAPIEIPGVEILDVVGRGAHSVVYRGRIGEELCAVKVRREPSSDPAAQRRPRYRREAAMLARFRHPGLSEVIEAGETPGQDRPYLIMEYVDGPTLARLLDRGGPMESERIVAIGTMVGAALVEVHRHGVVHRDIKPSNILVRQGDGAVKLIDFGFAARTERRDPDRAVVGTLRYSAPEQTGMLQRPVDGRADLYSLGVVLYECATGRPPFEASDPAELMRQHAVDAPPPIHQQNEGIGEALARVIAKLLAKDPDDRYATCEALLDDLARLESIEAALAAGEAVELGRSRLAARGRPLAELVGRHQEYSKLESAWLAARAGRGGVCWVSGEPGAGATRLVRELVERGAEDGAVVFTVSCDDAPRAPFGAVRRAGEIFVEHLRTLDVEEHADLFGRLAGAGRLHMPLLVDRGADIREIPQMAQSFVAEDPGMPVRFAESIASFFLEIACPDAPVLFVVDEIEHADEASLQVFRQLAHRVGERHFLLVCTAQQHCDGQRAAEAMLGGSEQLRLTEVRLGPIGEEAVVELVRRELGGKPLPLQTVSQIATRTRSNPGAVREYLFAMLEAGVLWPVRGGWRVDQRGLESLELPADLTHLMLRRVEELPADSRSILAQAALEGQRFHLSLLRSYSAASEARVRDALADAAALRLIEPVEEDRYAFVHRRIRRALQEELVGAERRAVHQRIAETLDGPELGDSRRLFAVARHYARGETDGASKRVYETNFRAGKISLERKAFEEAHDFLSAALEHADDLDGRRRVELERALGEACSATGRLAMSLECLDRAARLAEPGLERAKLRVQIARVQLAALDTDAALEQVHLGLSEFDRSIPSNRQLRLLGTVVLWMWTWLRIRLPGGRQCAETAGRRRVLVELYEVGAIISFFRLEADAMAAFDVRAVGQAIRLGDCPEKARALATHAAVQAVRGRPRAAAARAAEARRIAERLQNRSVSARTRWFEATGREIMGHAGRAEQQLRETIDEFGLWFELWEYLMVCGELGGLLLDRGFPREAGAWGRRILERTRPGDGRGLVHMERVYGLYLIACAKAWGGRGVEARNHVDEARRILEDHEAVGLGAVSALGYELAVHYESGDRGAEVDALLDRWASLGLLPERLPHQVRRFYVYQAYVRLERYRWAREFERDRAERHVEMALDELRRAGETPKYRAHLFVARAEWEQLQGDERRARRLLDEAAHLADAADSPWGTFEVEVRRARALARAGQQPAALRRARRAHDLAAAQGWRHRARKVRSEFDLSIVGDADSITASGSREGTRSGSQGSTDAQSLKLQRYLDALLEVALASATVFDPREQARVALDEIVRIFGAERAFLFADEDGRLEMLAGRDVRGRDLEDRGDYSASVLERVRREQKPLVSTGSDEGDVLSSASAVHHNLRSIMAGPVQIQDRFLGVVYVDSRIARGVFARDDAEILMAISSHIAIAQETARAAKLEVDVASERKKRELAEIIRQTTSAMTSTLDRGEVLGRLLDGLTKVVEVDRAVAFLMRDETLELFVEYGENGPEVGDASEWVFGDPRVQQVVETARPLLSGQSVDLGGSFSASDAHRSWLAVPILARGDLAGMLLIERDEPDAYTDDHVQLALALAGQAGIAVENARLFAAVEQLAIVDELTGLPNRRRLFEVAGEQFRRARRYEEPLSLLILDVDHFKRVNDTHGHAVGDVILQAVAQRCQEQLRETDSIGRYGGEEFVVVMPQTELAEAASQVAERLRRAVGDAPVSTEAGDVRVTISLGAAELASADQKVDHLLNRADEALYEAKQRGRNRVEVAQPSAE